MHTDINGRVKLPKTFLAVNLSEAFSFEEQDRQGSDQDVLEMKATPSKDLLSSHPPSGTDRVMTKAPTQVVNPE